MRTTQTTKETLTPLMQQYEELKAMHPEEILLFRLGDFYEMFGEDAQKAAPVLDLALTQRQGVPMCGIPYHALERYLPKLLKKGIRVAIAEQMEDPETAKGLVQREVLRVISPGTVIEEKLLTEKENNFLVSVALEKDASSPHRKAAIAALDISTGEFLIQEIEAGQNLASLLNELTKIAPAEILFCKGTELPKNFVNGLPLRFLEQREFEFFSLEKFFEKKETENKSAIGLLHSHPLTEEACCMALSYLTKVSPSFLQNLSPPKWMESTDWMNLDKETIENLEILRNSYDQTQEKTLLSFLDKTLTAMGGRLLKNWLIHPLLSQKQIQERLEIVDFLFQESALRKEAQNLLKGMSDIERVTSRVASGSAGPRDLLGLKISLQKTDSLQKYFESNEKKQISLSERPFPHTLKELLQKMGDWKTAIALLDAALEENPPIFLDKGGVIRSGYDAILDEKRRASEEGKNWLEKLERKEREKTQIPNLKVGYTSVFGYYLEVTKSHLAKVPAEWHRKQTLVNAERFITEELKELEQKIVGAEEQALRIEKKIFQELLLQIKEKTTALKQTAQALAQLDCFLSLAEVAESKGLTKPEIESSPLLEIQEGWHPVVKEHLPSGTFVSNDAFLDGGENQIVILTGPNMSGKSTYLRQTALIVLMAQMGSFVPAKKARIGIVDKVFTRIGSGDRLAQGESTFMVEMQETARILNSATSKSFVILDEVGRGTSTYDGISIAWAAIEHLATPSSSPPSKGGESVGVKPKVMFATHYFELTHLANEIEGVKNFNVQAKEWKDSVIFLHKIVPGPADRSYGIHVAKLAGLPESVIQRAKKILSQLEQEHISLLQSKSKESQEQFKFND